MEFKSDHANDILRNLNRERSTTKAFCDFIIKAGKEEFAIHRCVVGTFSKFFKHLLSIEMREKCSNEVTVQFSPTVVELIINFIYTSCVKISMEFVYEMLDASEFLETPYLKDYCGKVFKEHLNGENCLKIRAYAKLYQMQDIEQMTESFICDNLDSVLQSEDICDLAIDDVRTLLQKENDQPNIDEYKYNCLLNWTKHDIDARNNFFSSLFTSIDLPCVSKHILCTVVMEETLVQNSYKCIEQLLAALVSHDPEVQIAANRKHRLASEMEEILLIGGEKCPHSVVKYSVNSKQFSNMPNTNVVRKYASAVYYEGRVFVMGGHDERTALNSVEVLTLDEPTLKWEINQTSMIRKRSSFASALLNDVIYCIGGWSGFHDRSSIEGYNIKSGKRFQKMEMWGNRSRHAVVSMQGMLFVIGGFNGNTSQYGVSVFDPDVGNWRSAASMKRRRSYLCAVILNEEIYAIGGYNLSSVEKYNLTSKRWKDVASMNEKRCGGSACVINGRIYVFGGYPAQTIEVYDPEINEWKIEANMDQERRYLSAVAI